LGLVGLVITAVGKGTAHLLYLGRPERFIRAMARPDRSWIARGIWSMTSVVVFGGLQVLGTLGWIGGPLAPGAALWWIFTVLSGLAALLLMLYEGFLVSTSPAIPLWHTALMPILFAFYSLLGGLVLSTFINEITGAPVEGFLKLLESAILGLNFVLLLVFVAGGWTSSETARETVRQLLKGKLGVLFVGGVILVGIVLSMILGLYFASTGNLLAMWLVAATDLVGDFLLFYLLLKSGLFAPVY
ncbi:MAG: polysulfide reductase NrfD, partial [Firmicutes bacterium]|nr:polysulfide reductase NrfD [Bacillota bacterium]